jgi:hypothetical protein
MISQQVQREASSTAFSFGSSSVGAKAVPQLNDGDEEDEAQEEGGEEDQENAQLDVAPAENADGLSAQPMPPPHPTPMVIILILRLC